MNSYLLKCLLALSVAAALSLGASAAVYRHDFGTIVEDGGVVAHRFALPGGTASLSVTVVRSGCPCVTVDYPHRSLDAGVPLDVTLRFDPGRQQGHFVKSVYLRLSGGRRDTLVVTGNVERARTRIDISGYPADFGAGLRLDRAVIDFGRVRRGEKKEITVPVMNAYEVGMNLDFSVGGRDSLMVTVPYGLKLGPLGHSEIKVVIDIPDSLSGMSNGCARYVPDIFLKPDVNGYSCFKIPVRASIRR